MGRKKTDLIRLERIQHILDLFRVHKCLGKPELDSALAAVTGIPVKNLKQSTYRDLRWLGDNGRLAVRHKLADGTKLKDGEETDSGPYKSEWYLPEATPQFIGSGLISNSGAEIYYSSSLNGMFRVLDTGAGQIEPENCINLEGRLNSHLICLSVDADALPFSIIIGRVTDKDRKNSNMVFEQVEEQFGQRTIYLHLQIDAISSFKGPHRAGHCAIIFGEVKNEATIINLGSTNPTLIEGKAITDAINASRSKIPYLPDNNHRRT